AAIFGATMAVVSAGINALATAALLDFLPTLRGAAGSGQEQVRLARGLTVLFGFLSTSLALVVGGLGTLLEATNQIMGLFGGPLLGIFFLGVLARRANGSGALLGAVGGAFLGCLVAFSQPWLGVPISFMWIAFASATGTFLLGQFASLLFAAPGPEAQALV